MQNVDAQGTAHYPGWTMEALKYLYEVRYITATGHETTDTDPGLATTKEDYSLESYILGIDRYQIELLANLDQVPESLLPMLACKWLIPITMVDIMIVTVAFLVGELIGSRLLFKLNIRDRPF